MNKKVVTGIMMTLLLTSVLSVAFYFVLVASPDPEEPIKIGVMAPLSWLHGQGIMEGATLAAEEINASGGILGRNVTLVFADTTSDPEDPSPIVEALGRAAAEELIAAGVDFVIGGLRSEAVFGAREVFMNHTKIFIITASGTDELVDCGDHYDPDGPWGPSPPGPCNACVRCNYTRYKYLFRVAPVNTSTIVRSLLSFHRFVLEMKLLPIYGKLLWEGAPNPQVRVAVVSDNLTWTDTLHWYLTNPAVYPDVLGPYANVTYSTRVRHNATDFAAEMTAIKESEARLIIHMLSGTAGAYFIGYWRAMGVEAVPVGINVLSQHSEMLNWTAGKCEYETILAPSGTRTPITNQSIPFWNAYVERFGHDPRYTSWAAYSAIHTLTEAIERAGTIDSNDVVAELEQTDRIGPTGRFKFTQYHDVFCNEIGPTWTQGYVRPFVVQWKAEEMKVVWPRDKPYSIKYMIPTWMYELSETDFIINGLVDIAEISAVTSLWCEPPPWQLLEADINDDGIIAIDDLARVALDWGKNATKIHGQWPLP